MSKSKTPTGTPTSSITPTPLITKSLGINQESYFGPKTLYFVSKEKTLNILDIFSGSFQQIAEVEKFDKDSTLFWIDDSSLAIWTSDQLYSLNLNTNSVQNITSSKYKYRSSLLSSDLSSERKFLVSYGVQRNDPRTIYGHDSFLLFLIDLDNKEEMSSPINIGLDLNGVYEASCIRWRPNSSIPTVSLRVAELEGLVIGKPSLAVLRIGPEESPIILKENIIDCPSWSPDGEKIVYGKSGESNQGIYYIDVVLNAVTKITDTDGYYPAWSPDGKLIAFITDEGIYLINVATREEIKIYSGEVLALLWGK